MEWDCRIRSWGSRPRALKRRLDSINLEPLRRGLKGAEDNISGLFFGAYVETEGLDPMYMAAWERGGWMGTLFRWRGLGVGFCFWIRWLPSAPADRLATTTTTLLLAGWMESSWVDGEQLGWDVVQRLTCGVGR